MDRCFRSAAILEDLDDILLLGGFFPLPELDADAKSPDSLAGTFDDDAGGF